MLKNRKNIIFILCLTSSLHAFSLQESVEEAVATNPVVQERLKDYRSTQQDLNVAESEYYPTIDFRGVLGFNKTGHLKNEVNDGSYTNYESSITLVQNLFDGFGTTSKVDYQENRILSSAYNYLETANDIAFKMVDAYLNVLREHELLQTSIENVQIDITIYKKVKDLFDSGLTTESEVKKIQAALSLARVNLTVQLNNTHDAEYSYRRLLGRMPIVSEMFRPELTISMPESVERAALYSINHNPSILVSRYNIKGAQALYTQSKQGNYPSVDFEMSQFFNGQSEANGFDSEDDRFRARIVLNYNLFRGGSDEASAQKNISEINREIEIQRDLKRQVVEGLDLSWSTYKMVSLQLRDLKDYKAFSEKTLLLYKEEYDLGRRSLLDLLSSQNDVINSRSQIIRADYQLLFAKYRILDAMGLLPRAILGESENLAADVNLYTNSEAQEFLDTIPVELDADHDNIVDNEDICDNSILQNNIMPYGCVKITRDSDEDGIEDAEDQCQLTPKHASIYPNGCAIDMDQDGVPDYEDQCLQTPFGYDVNNAGCSIATSMEVNFKEKSFEISAKLDKEISDFIFFMKENASYVANIIAYDQVSEKLSQERAENFKKALIEYGINRSKVTTEGKVFEVENLDSNTTTQPMNKNSVIEIELTQEGDSFDS